MHLILTGATGLVGVGVLEAMLRTPTVTKISVLSRRPVPFLQDKYPDDPRVNVIIHKDYSSYPPAVLDQLRGAKGCVWAQGTSTTQIASEADYVAITKDWPLAAAAAFSTLAEDAPTAGSKENVEVGSGGSSSARDGKFRFIYISGEGATHTPGRFSAMFARVKGQAELSLSELPSTRPTLQVDSVRPGGVDDGDNEAVRGYAPKAPFTLRLLRVTLMPVIKTVMRDMHAPTKELGEFCVGLATGRVGDGELERLKGKGAERLGGGWLVTNAGFRRVMDGLKK